MLSKKIILLIIVVVLVGVSAALVLNEYAQPASTNIMKGNHNVLVLLADTDEQRPGIGAVDMAFAINVVNGNIGKVTPIYPGGMRSPTLMEPAAAGTGHMLLNDALWYNNTSQDAADAQEIVQANTGIKTDAVVIVTPAAADAVVTAIGPIYIQGYGNVWSNDTEDFIRNMTEEKNSTLSRGTATEMVMDPIFAAAKNPSKAPALFQAVATQYLNGNIIVFPKDLMTQFLVSKGLNSL